MNPAKTPIQMASRFDGCQGSCRNLMAGPKFSVEGTRPGLGRRHGYMSGIPAALPRFSGDKKRREVNRRHTRDSEDRLDVKRGRERCRPAEYHCEGPRDSPRAFRCLARRRALCHRWAPSSVVRDSAIDKSSLSNRTCYILLAHHSEPCQPVSCPAAKKESNWAVRVERRRSSPLKRNSKRAVLDGPN